jgi:hypothetical protein
MCEIIENVGASVQWEEWRPLRARRPRDWFSGFPAGPRVTILHGEAARCAKRQGGSMPRHEFDRSSKYLVQRQGKGILWLGGARDVHLCCALHAELVQPRRLPDGLLEVFFRGRSTPDHVLVEVATYAEKRVLKQALDDLTLAYQQLGTLPELLMLVLRPRGAVPSCRSS